MSALGATAALCDGFGDNYVASSRLLPVPPDHRRIDRQIWYVHLGGRQLKGDYRAFFAGCRAVIWMDNIPSRAHFCRLKGSASISVQTGGLASNVDRRQQAG